MSLVSPAMRQLLSVVLALFPLSIAYVQCPLGPGALCTDCIENQGDPCSTTVVGACGTCDVNACLHTHFEHETQYYGYDQPPSLCPTPSPTDYPTTNPTTNNPTPAEGSFATVTDPTQKCFGASLEYDNSAGELSAAMAAFVSPVAFSLEDAPPGPAAVPEAALILGEGESLTPGTTQQTWLHDLVKVNMVDSSGQPLTFDLETDSYAVGFPPVSSTARRRRRLLDHQFDYKKSTGLTCLHSYLDANNQASYSSSKDCEFQSFDDGVDVWDTCKCKSLKKQSSVGVADVAFEINFPATQDLTRMASMAFLETHFTPTVAVGVLLFLYLFVAWCITTRDKAHIAAFLQRRGASDYSRARFAAAKVHADHRKELYKSKRYCSIAVEHFKSRFRIDHNYYALVKPPRIDSAKLLSNERLLSVLVTSMTSLMGTAFFYGTDNTGTAKLYQMVFVSVFAALVAMPTVKLFQKGKSFDVLSARERSAVLQARQREWAATTAKWVPISSTLSVHGKSRGVVTKRARPKRSVRRTAGSRSGRLVRATTRTRGNSTTASSTTSLPHIQQHAVVVRSRGEAKYARPKGRQLWTRARQLALQSSWRRLVSLRLRVRRGGVTFPGWLEGKKLAALVFSVVWVSTCAFLVLLWGVAIDRIIATKQRQGELGDAQVVQGAPPSADWVFLWGFGMLFDIFVSQPAKLFAAGLHGIWLTRKLLQRGKIKKKKKKKRCGCSCFGNKSRASKKVEPLEQAVHVVEVASGDEGAASNLTPKAPQSTNSKMVTRVPTLKFKGNKNIPP